jgi:peptide/nickel transport system substrate-binding protein
MKRLIGVLVGCALALSGAAAAQIKEGKIRMGVDSLPLSFGNPYRTAQIPTTFTTSAIFDGLTRIALDGTLNPWLATSWTSEDTVTWRFTLRDDVTFSNGAPFSADAVKVAIDYLTSPDAARDALNREIPALRSARVIDPRTIEIALVEPDALFPRSASALFIAEPGEWLRLGRDEFGKTPVGTGPFKLERWEPNRAVLTAHEASWRKPKRRELEIIAIPEAASRAQALLAGRIDAAVGLSPESVELIEQSGGQGLRVPTAQVWGWSFVLMRDGKKVEGPLQDRRVRQALTMAVNRQLIVDTLLGGTARVAAQGATPAVYGYNPNIKPLPFDPAAAKKLLAEAGYPDGFEMTVLSSAGAAGADREIHQRMASDLQSIGVRVEVRSVPIQQYLQYLSQGSFPTDAFGMSYPADPNIDAIRPLRIHSCLRRQPFYCDESIMPQIRAALVSRDPQESLRLRHEILAWYHQEAPILFVYEGVRFYGRGAKVQGLSEAHGYIAYDQIDFAP